MLSCKLSRNVNVVKLLSVGLLAWESNQTKLFKPTYDPGVIKREKRLWKLAG